MTEPTNDPAPQEPTSATGPDLGDAGKQALDRMKADRDAAQKELKTLQQQVKELQERDPVKVIAEALGVKPNDAKPDDLAETVKHLQQQMRDAELRAARLEVGAEKGLTPAQAAELRGSSREELAAHADKLKELFPTSATPGTPAPDPTQGPRGGASALEAQLKAAQDKGDTKEAIRLKTLIAAQRQGK